MQGAVDCTPRGLSRLAVKDIGETMKRFLLAVIALTLLSAGGIYFAAETVILPKQEKIWRALLTDLPHGLEADFEDVDFELVGLRLSIGGATIGDGKGNAVKVSEIVAENSLPTALGNLTRFVLGKEEERYDVVRFIGVEPLQPEMGVSIEIQEVRLLDVAIGIDNELPSTIKALTGAVNLEKALSAASMGGYEIHGVSATGQGIVGTLEMMRVHEITKTNVGLVEVSGLSVAQGTQSLASLSLLRTTNFNIASMMEPTQVMTGLEMGVSTPPGKPGNVGMASFNLFHFADEFVIVDLDAGVPGLAGVAIKRLMYSEEETEMVPGAGIVPTRTFSEVRDFSVQFPALAMMSPDAALFMDVTGIKGFEINSEDDYSWDLKSGTSIGSGWGEFTDLVKVSAAFEVGNFFPEDVIKVLAWSEGMTKVEGPVTNPLMSQSLMQKFQSAQSIYGDITLVNFDYLIENKSLVERLYRYGEALTGMPKADLKAFLDMQLKAAQEDPMLPPSMIDDIGALRTFVAEPISLRITLTPPETISIDSLMAAPDAEKLLEKMGLTITANEKL